MIKKTVWLSEDGVGGFCGRFQSLLAAAFSNSTISNLETAINEQLSGLLGTPQTGSIVGEMYDQFFDGDPTCNHWTNMPLYYSSYKFDFDNQRLDTTIITRCQKDLEFYLSWFLKILKTDLTSIENIQRSKEASRQTSKSGTDTRTATSTTDNTSGTDESDTPQLGQVDFEEDTLDYRSGMTRSKGHSTDNSSSSRQTSRSGSVSDTGTSSDTHVAQTFEEQRKMMAMRYFNDMVDRIYDIPRRIYNYYSIDVIPTGEALQILEESRAMAHEI